MSDGGFVVDSARLTRARSPLAAALVSFHRGNNSATVTVKNDFGQSEELPASLFFRREEDFEEWEGLALERCGTRVLDVGAGVGAHALPLQERGYRVTALELLPDAVRIMRERGVTDVRQGTLADVTDWATYDTLLLLMHGSMIAESLLGLDRLLDRAALLVTPGGVLLMDSTDLREDGSVEFQLEDDGRYFGELHYQLSAGGVESEIFPQLFVDAETLAEHGQRAGWDTEIVWRGPGGRYLAELTSVADHRARHDGSVSKALS